MNKTRVFQTDYLKKDLKLPRSAVYDTVISKSNGAEHHEIFFKCDGYWWLAHYDIRHKDEEPWKFEDRIECVQVVRDES